MRISDWSSDVCSSDLIAEGLVRWIAPILSYTADEIWNMLPGDRSQTIFAQPWYVLPKMPDTAVDWTALKAVREPVKKVLEELRVAGKIGRPEERRVGKDGVGLCRSGWSPDHKH